ncbi:phage terminase small subunit P27 family [Methylorubrum populi]
MTRGRKPDGPALQVAKGQPGKRPRARRADQRAARLAENDPLHPPAFLVGTEADPALAEALEIWRELATHLLRRNLLDRLDRYAFARWCVYQAEWIDATRTIQREGLTRMVSTVSGDAMPRRHPAAMHRDRVELSMAKLEAAYGLTPADRYKVMRDQAAVPIDGLGLFGQGEAKPAAAAPSTPRSSDPVGFLADRSAPPPGTRPN